MSTGTPISESERSCTTDPLWAHVRALSKIDRVGGAWTSYGSLSRYIDTASGYDFCRISKTEFYVKKVC